MDVVRLQYGYDRAGNRLYRRDYLALANSASFDELYDYDGLDRLTSFDRGELNSANTGLTGGPTLTQDWTLDGTGNWSGFSQTVQSALTQTRTHNPVNEITGISETVGTAWPDPSYDANGNTTSFPKPASLGDGMTATYDAWNRLVKVADSGGTVAEYQYDGLDRRTEKIAGGTTLHDYFSDQWQTLEERTGSSASADRQFVWGQRYLDDLILRDRASERLYALQDALFNVVALTSNTGAVQERFAYQPYGQSEPLDSDFSAYLGTDLNWEYRFTGRELDLESGLQINRHRYLHLQLGRWITRDPVGDQLGEVNRYLYVRLHPTISTDPSGLIDGQPEWKLLLQNAANLHGRYFYRGPIGHEAFVAKLKTEVVPHLNFDSGSNLGDADAIYYPISNTIAYRPPMGLVSRLTALHETVHALNDFEGRYGWDAESDEALAWGATAIYDMINLSPLRIFERDLPNLDCAQAKERWANIWDKNVIGSLPDRLLSATLAWGGGGANSRSLTNEDYLDIEKHLGLKVRCSELAAIYETLPTDSSYDNPCKLCCPKQLPKAFE